MQFICFTLFRKWLRIERRAASSNESLIRVGTATHDDKSFRNFIFEFPHRRHELAAAHVCHFIFCCCSRTVPVQVLNEND